MCLQITTYKKYTYICFRGVGTGVRLADNESVSVVSGSSFSLSLPNGFVEILYKKQIEDKNHNQFSIIVTRHLRCVTKCGIYLICHRVSTNG